METATQPQRAASQGLGLLSWRPEHLTAGVPELMKGHTPQSGRIHPAEVCPPPFILGFQATLQPPGRVPTPPLDGRRVALSPGQKEQLPEKLRLLLAFPEPRFQTHPTPQPQREASEEAFSILPAGCLTNISPTSQHCSHPPPATQLQKEEAVTDNDTK